MKPVVFHELLGERHFAKVQPATFVKLTQRYRNQDAAKTVSLDKLNNEEWKWSKGECMRLNNWQALHWTENTSNIDRVILKITGIKS